MSTITTHPLRDAERLRRLVMRQLGLRLRRDQLPELTRIMAERCSAIGCPDTASYLAGGVGTHEEWRHLASVLTVGESYFWRNPPHLAVFRDILATAPSDRALRVLSAGCARGEEPYTLAIQADLVGHPVRVTAFDLDMKSLAHAERAEYAWRALRELPAAVLATYFGPANAAGRRRLDPRISTTVQLAEYNLADDLAPWAPASFDVVYCRNVLMYLARPVARRAVARFADALVDGGVLFLGHAETVRGLSDAFQVEHAHGTFYYRKERPGQAAGHRGLSQVTLHATAAVPPTADWRAQKTSTAPPSVPIVRTAPPVAFDLERARRHFQAGDAAATLAALPADATGPAAVLRAAALVSIGCLEEARGALQAILAVDDLAADALGLLAFCVGELGASEDAMEHEHAAMYLDPEFALVRLQHGRRLARRPEQAAAARRDLERALVLLPGETADRVLLFGGGLSRAALADLARAELRRLGGAS